MARILTFFHPCCPKLGFFSVAVALLVYSPLVFNFGVPTLYQLFNFFLGFGASFLFVFANNHCLMPFISLSLDNDECSPVGDCMHICENTPGSYNCKCNADFKVDPDDLKKCIRE